MIWSCWKSTRWTLYLVLATSALPSISQNADATPSREEREVKTAEQAVVASMVVSRSPKDAIGARKIL